VECTGGHCVHSICRSTTTYCGDTYCDTGEYCDVCIADCGACPGGSSSGSGSGPSGTYETTTVVSTTVERATTTEAQTTSPTTTAPRLHTKRTDYTPIFIALVLSFFAIILIRNKLF
jgi:hypothetical protein